MKAPVESGRRDRPSVKRNTRRAEWRRSLRLFRADVRRHPALAVLLAGYVAIFAAGWWFYLAAPQPADLEPASVDAAAAMAKDGSDGVESEEAEIQLATRQVLQPPRAGAPFGTDRHGVGVLTRVLRGAAETLSVALVGSTLAVAIGFLAVLFVRWLLGARGYLVIVWLAGGVTCIPAVALAWWLAAALEPGFWSVCVIVAVAGAMPVTHRLARAFEACEDLGHVVSAAAAGFGRFEILRTQVFPFVWQRLVSYGAMLLPGALLLETALTFAGLGLGKAATDSWGRLIAEGRSLMFEAPWLLIAPGLVIAGTVGWLSLTARSIRKVTREKDFLSLV